MTPKYPEEQESSMRGKLIFFVVFLSVIMLTGSGCDDSSLHGTAPIAERYYTGIWPPSPTRT
jgi:hypothetical protein